MPLWNEIEGKNLAEGLALRTLLRSEGRTAWFATTDRDGKPAVVSVFETLNDDDRVLARLEAAARVQHPNLLAIRATGAARLDDESLMYAVMEPFDQTLTDVLRDRALTPDEAKEVAEHLLGGLEAVEAAGLFHGHVDATGVLAVGDAIKLRSDCLVPRQNASDAPALAALLYNALTTRRFSSERDAAQLPAPFAALVRAGTGSGGSLAAMRRVLTGPAVSTAPPAVTASAVAAATSVTAASVVAPAVAAAAANASVAEARPVEATAPKAAGPRLDPRAAAYAAASRADLNEEPARPVRRPGVAIAAVVLMAILLMVFWLAFKRPAGHTPVTGQAATVAPAPEPTTPPVTPAPNAAEQSAAAMGAPSSTPAPRATPLAPPSSNVPAAASETAGGRSVWHVVVYTYDREVKAQQKATQLAAKFPQLEPQVFSPTGDAPYLVVLGAGADRKEAYARRDAARAAGMPRDTYAQNFRK